MEISQHIALLISILAPLVPFLLGLYRYKKIDGSYYPFIAVLGCAVLSETYRTIQLYNYYQGWNWPVGISTIGYNLYVLAIGLLYTILFYKWGLFENKTKPYYLVLIILSIAWVFDHLIINGNRIASPTKYYRLFYSLLLCLFAISHINKLIVSEKHSLLRNASFLICLGLLFFFVPYIIIEGVFLFSPKTSPDFYISVYQIRGRFNPLIYLIFTVAILWIPPKKPFIQLS